MSEKYTSCFVAIPLPGQYHQEQRQLGDALWKVDNGITPKKTRIPHITIGFLTKLTQQELNIVEQVLRHQSDAWRGTRLTVGGFGFFDENNPELIYLQVSDREPLLGMRRFMEEHPEIPVPGVPYPYEPHLSLGVLTKEAKGRFGQTRPLLQALVDSAKSWSFRVAEIGIYGMNGNNQVEKLRSVPVLHT